MSFKRTFRTLGNPITTRGRHPCVSQILITPPNSLAILAWVKITQPNQSHTNTQESFVHKVRLGWGEPFEKTTMLSLARELKILVSVVRFRPGPPYIHRSRKTAVFSFVLVQTFALCVRKNNLRSPHFSNTLFNFA